MRRRAVEAVAVAAMLLGGLLAYQGFSTQGPPAQPEPPAPPTPVVVEEPTPGVAEV